MSTVTFQECQKYIEALKKETVFWEIKGNEAKKELEREELKNKVLLINSKKSHIITIETEEGFHSFYFEEDSLQKKELLASLEPYYQELYSCSLFRIDLSLLLLFLEADEQNLYIAHKNILLEEGLKVTKDLLNMPDTVFVTFYWHNGPMLLCSQQEGLDFFSCSHQQENLSQEEALAKIRSQYQDIPCTIKVLKKSTTTPPDLVEDFEEDILVSKKPTQTTAKSSHEPVATKSTGPKISEKQIHKDVATEKPSKGSEQNNNAPANKKLEDSVVIREDELPTVGPQDAAVLNKYGIHFAPETEVPLDKEVSLSEEEMGILKKYGLSLPQKETTCREVRENFEESVILRSQELPPVKPEDASVLQKYGIYLTPPQGAAEIAIQAYDLAVLQKYGLKLPHGEQTSLQELVEAYNMAIALKKLTPYKISMRDRPVFQKYKLELPEKPLYQRVLPYVVIPVLVLLMIYLGSFAGSIYRAKQYREQSLAFCEQKMQDLGKYSDGLKKQTDDIRNILATLVRQYPSQEGYPESNPKIVERLAVLDKHLVDVQNGLIKAKELLDSEDFEEARKNLLGTDKIRKSVESGWLEELRRFRRWVDSSLGMAQFMYERRKQVREIRRASHILRDHIMTLAQKVQNIEELLEILQETYPSDKGFPAVPVEPAKSIQQKKAKITEFQEALQKIENALLSDQLTEGSNLAKPYLQWGKVDTSGLDEMNDEIRRRISYCEKLAREQEMRRESMQIIMEFEKTLESARQELQLLDRFVKKLQKFPEEMNISRPDKEATPFLSKAKSEVKQVETTLQKGRELLYQNHLQEAIELLKPLDKPSFAKLVLNLQQVKENVQDAFQIAENVERRNIQGKEIASLLQLTKEKLSPLREITKNIHEKLAILGNNFPGSEGFPVPATAYEASLQKGNKLREKLQETVEQVKVLVRQKDFKSALDILRKKEAIEDAGKILPKLQQTSHEVEELLAKCHLIAQEREMTGKINTETEKIHKYLKDLEEQLTPLKASTKEIAENFPVGEGYPQPPSAALDTLEKGESIAQKLHETLQSTEASVTKKDFAVALERLKTTTPKVLNRDIIPTLSQYRYQLDDLVYEARTTKTNRAKASEIKELVHELQERYNSLKKLLPMCGETFKTLTTQYPAEKGYFPAYVGTADVIKEGQYEQEELSKVIAEGEEYLHSGKYDKTLEFLRPYSHKVTPGLSRLPVVQSICQRLQETLEKNQRLDSDSTFKQQIEEKRKQEEIRRLQRVQWAKPPGAWYTSLKPSLEDYEKLLPSLANSLQDEGSSFLFTKLKSTLAELNGFPDKIADLEEMIYNIQAKGGNLKAMLRKKQDDAMTPGQFEQIGAVRKYLSTKQFELNIGEQLPKLQTTVAQLKKELEKNAAPSKDLLKDLLRVFTQIESKYTDVYQPVHSLLINMEASLSEK